MARQWFGGAWGQGTIPGIEFGGTLAPVFGFTGPTLLRTRAHVQVTAATDNVPAMYPGNNIPPLVFRIIMGTAADPTPPGWPNDADAGDDVVFDALHWTAATVIPADPTVGRLEKIYQWASLESGVADSAGQRHFDPGVGPIATWDVRYLDITGSTLTPSFACSVWLRQLYNF